MGEEIKGDDLKRVLEMEAILDKARELLDILEENIVRLKEFQPEVSRLEAYYTSPQWRKDFNADEKGMFPEGLKRGVLSEDGIYDLLERNKEILEALKGL